MVCNLLRPDEFRRPPAPFFVGSSPGGVVYNASGVIKRGWESTNFLDFPAMFQRLNRNGDLGWLKQLKQPPQSYSRISPLWVAIFSDIPGWRILHCYYTSKRTLPWTISAAIQMLHVQILCELSSLVNRSFIPALVLGTAGYLTPITRKFLT